jgi:hypothetical protein
MRKRSAAAGVRAFVRTNGTVCVCRVSCVVCVCVCRVCAPGACVRVCRVCRVQVSHGLVARSSIPRATTVRCTVGLGKSHGRSVN